MVMQLRENRPETHLISFGFWSLIEYRCNYISTTLFIFFKYPCYQFWQYMVMQLGENKASQVGSLSQGFTNSFCGGNAITSINITQTCVSHAVT